MDATPCGPGTARMTWLIYILRCNDGTLYTGITNDLAARLHAHHAGKGAAYTRGRGPFEVVYTEPAKTRAHAQRREDAIKRLPRAAKIRLADGNGGLRTHRIRPT